MSVVEDLKRDEGLKRAAYKDTAGLLTIGYGRMIDPIQGGGISEAEADYLLANDIAKAEAELDRSLAWWRGRPDAVQRGMVNMMLNMGAVRLGGFKRMLSCLQAGDYDTAAAEALDSAWAKQVGARAVRIANLFIEAKDLA